MADEVTTPGADDIESPDFNWAQFFASPDEEPQAVAPAPVQQAASSADDEYEDEAEDTTTLRTQIAELQAIVKDATKTTTELATKQRITAAVDAWRQQASPSELMMVDVLAEATSLEDLQQRASLVKRVSSGTEKLIAGERQRIEQDLQRKFGLPVQPTFDPVPEKEKMNQALADGDIERAASEALKGVFTT